ncbi:hypothetical protein TSAR_012012, partial [Trichomalopsis sarcophagae]
HDASKGKPGIPKTNCGLSHDGHVTCVPAVKYSTNCLPDFTDYPYDLQVCTIDLASWAYSTDEIQLLMLRKPVTSDLSPGQEWDVLYSTSYVLNESFKMNQNLSARVYYLFFIMGRRAENMHILLIAPAFVLMVLTLCALWMDCHSDERMIVSSISFICHLVCIQHVYWKIPHNGNDAPNLLRKIRMFTTVRYYESSFLIMAFAMILTVLLRELHALKSPAPEWLSSTTSSILRSKVGQLLLLIRYYESSFLIMAFVMVLTVLLRELHALKSPAPEWLSSTTSSILRSKVGQLLLLSILDPKASAFLEISADDNDELVDGDGEDRSKSKSNTSTWSYVALMIGWLAFVLTFFTYIVMLPMYLPYKSTYDPAIFSNK